MAGSAIFNQLDYRAVIEQMRVNYVCCNRVSGINSEQEFLALVEKGFNRIQTAE